MKEFIIKALSKNGDVSSKRVFGALGFVCSIIFIAIWQHDLIDMLLITSASLLGLEKITDIFTKKVAK
jgi:TfoX/Sxy family transcriptional regulator of competence genes